MYGKRGLYNKNKELVGVVSQLFSSNDEEEDMIQINFINSFKQKSLMLTYDEFDDYKEEHEMKEEHEVDFVNVEDWE